MARKLFWLSSEEWARIEPHLPRGRRGARRVDEQTGHFRHHSRVKTGARWARLPGGVRPLYDDLQPLQPMEQTRGVGGRLLRPERVERGCQHDGGRTPRQGAPLSGGGKRGDFEHAIGRSRGGRTTKLHAITDHAGRPRAFPSPPGRRTTWSAPRRSSEGISTPRRLIADRAYDARKFRDWLAERDCEAVIPPNPTREAPTPMIPSPIEAETSSNACSVGSRTSEGSPPATKRADTSLSAVFIAALFLWWLN